MCSSVLDTQSEGIILPAAVKNPWSVLGLSSFLVVFLGVLPQFGHKAEHAPISNPHGTSSSMATLSGTAIVVEASEEKRAKMMSTSCTLALVLPGALHCVSSFSFVLWYIPDFFLSFFFSSEPDPSVLWPAKPAEPTRPKRLGAGGADFDATPLVQVMVVAARGAPTTVDNGPQNSAEHGRLAVSGGLTPVRRRHKADERGSCALTQI